MRKAASLTSNLAVPSLIALSLISWGLGILASRYPGYIYFDTADAVMASRQGFTFDSDKHPPLLLWILHSVQFVLPLNRHVLMLVAIAMILVAIGSIWKIARMTIGRERALLALALCGFVPYLTWVGLRLNHNTLLIALWPLCIWLFLECLRRLSVLNGCLFGAVAALGVLAKYYLGLLLVSMVIVSFLSTRRWRFYSGPGPYVAVAVFFVLLSPHIASAYFAHYGPILKSGDPTRLHPLAYALQPDVEAGRLGRLLLENGLALGSLTVGFVVLLALQRGRSLVAGSRNNSGLVRLLVLLCALPFALTILLSLVFRLEARGDWTGPLFTMAPILLARYLPVPSRQMKRTLAMLCIAVCLAIPLLGRATLLVNFWQGNRSAVMPYFELARKGAAVFADATGGPVRLISGDARIGVAGALKLPEQPTFNGYREPVTKERIRREGMLIVCTQEDRACNAEARFFEAKSCEISASRKLWFMQGLTFRVTSYIVPPDGARINATVLAEQCG